MRIRTEEKDSIIIYSIDNIEEIKHRFFIYGNGDWYLPIYRREKYLECLKKERKRIEYRISKDVMNAYNDKANIRSRIFTELKNAYHKFESERNRAINVEDEL